MDNQHSIDVLATAVLAIIMASNDMDLRQWEEVIDTDDPEVIRLYAHQYSYNPKNIPVVTLSLAIKLNKINSLRTLLGLGVKPDNSAFNTALELNSLDSIKELVRFKFSLAEHRNAVIKAAELGHLELVKYFVENKIPNRRFTDLALITAAEKGKTEILKYLIHTVKLRAGFSNWFHKKVINKLSDWNVLIEALKTAISNSNYSDAKILVESGANLERLSSGLKANYNFHVNYKTYSKPINHGCCILLRDIEPNEEYITCSKIPDEHIYVKTAIDDWFRTRGQYECLICFSPLDPKIFINREKN